MPTDATATADAPAKKATRFTFAQLDDVLAREIERRKKVFAKAVHQELMTPEAARFELDAVRAARRLIGSFGVIAEHGVPVE